MPMSTMEVRSTNSETAKTSFPKHSRRHFEKAKRPSDDERRALGLANSDGAVGEVRISRTQLARRPLGWL